MSQLEEENPDIPATWAKSAILHQGRQSLFTATVEGLTTGGPGVVNGALTRHLAQLLITVALGLL
jgi:hypothetical protein